MVPPRLRNMQREIMAEQTNSPTSARSSRFWYGVAVGVGAIVLLIVAVMAIGFLVMGRCPMCGRITEMNGSDMPGGMMGGGGMMDEGAMMGSNRDAATQPQGMMGGDMPQWMMSSGPMAHMMQDMPVIHKLLVNHEKIERKVEDIPNGIRSVTTSEAPEVADLIRKHVYQMKERVEQGKPIRMMDPVFREIFEHHDKIHIRIEEIPRRRPRDRDLARSAGRLAHPPARPPGRLRVCGGRDAAGDAAHSAAGGVQSRPEEAVEIRVRGFGWRYL